MDNSSTYNVPLILMGSSQAWRKIEKHGFEIWYAGNSNAVLEIIKYLSDQQFDIKKLGSFLSQRNEIFSVIAVKNNALFSITDFCRSYPVFYSINNKQLLISNDANCIKKRIKNAEVNQDSVFDCVTSGYVTGHNTLYTDIKQMKVCEYLLHTADDSSPQIKSYFLYHNNNSQIESKQLINSLGSVIDESINRLITSSNNARIMVPISGGLDSRLILAKLVEHGYKNIGAFSYGPVGNSDAKIGQYVSEQLGVNWEFVSIKPDVAKKFYNSELRKDYSNFADGLNVVPSYQDLLPIYQLMQSGKILPDDLIVNGQSGDFNSGGHIPVKLMNIEANMDDFLNELIKKHYSLWKNILTESSTKLIKNKIVSLLEESNSEVFNDDLSNEKLADLYERWEFEERQTKYIINGQRVYDYFSLKWQLPLWDGEFVRFWCNVPVDMRYKQTLYREYLETWNYKGLFKEFKPTINAWSKKASYFIIPLSLMLRMTLGRKRRNHLIKYFDYISRYGNHYHSFGFKVFANNIHQIKNPFSLYTLSWLCERGFSSQIKEIGLDPLFDN